MIQDVNHPIIETHQLRRRYGRGEAAMDGLAGVDLTIRRGELVALMGPSGSGKSTLMQILGLLDRPTSGSYYLDGTDVSRLTTAEQAELRGRRLGFVFQGIYLLPRLNAIRNVELPMVYARFPASERKHRAADSLSRVGLAELANRRPNQLSGGQAQRVAIARAVAPGPDLLLADEPTGALDRASGREVLSLFQHLNDDMGLTIVVVTHDPLVGRHARRIVELEDGHVISDNIVNEAERIVADHPLEVVK